jgi:tetratricopeptide (TPR) repeat protein
MGRVVLVMVLAGSAWAADLSTAERLAWDKRFAESEAMYRAILATEPSERARLGLARVVMWQGRYDEAIALFAKLDGVDALEGRATAEYWSGDLRSAARHFRDVLEREPNREFARTSLREIQQVARPSQRLTVDAVHDDQPLDAVRAEAAATFFSDPLTRWSVAAGAYRLDAERRGTRDGQFALVENETRFPRFTIGGSLGVFTFPDGEHRPIGSVRVAHRQLELRVDHREEIASATALQTHASSTTTTLRWSREKNWIAAAELIHKRYFDDNEGRAFVAYAVAPWKRGAWTFWGGGSVSARDTDESRFRQTAVSSTFDQSFFRYGYRGEYDPYWTPDELREARAVLAVERQMHRGGIKLHGDFGYARDRGRAFGPDAGPTPLPATTFAFTFDRSYHPWRAGLSAHVNLAPSWRLEASVERSVTVDYRSTSVHASLVRRR